MRASRRPRVQAPNESLALASREGSDTVLVHGSSGLMVLLRDTLEADLIVQALDFGGQWGVVKYPPHLLVQGLSSMRATWDIWSEDPQSNDWGTYGLRPPPPSLFLCGIAGGGEQGFGHTSIAEFACIYR